MKYVFLPALILCSCIQQQADMREKSKQEIMDADRAMSVLAAKEGFHQALLTYADDSVIKPKEGEFPVIGKSALETSWAKATETKNITWEPFRAEAARSGDLGYSIGNWKFVMKDTTLFGNYYTIWKKQSDGKWKFVFDGGNGTPSQDAVSK